MSRATLILSLFVFLIALPSLNATATLSRGRSVIPHRAIAGRRSIPRSGSALPLAKRKRCKAKSSSVSSSAATATVQAVHVDTTTTVAEVTTSSSKVTPTSTTEAAATTKTTAAETTHQTTTQHTTEAQTKEAPTTTTTHKATTTQQTTVKAQTTTQSSGSSGSSAVDNYFAGVNTGEGTFYNTGLDACGFTDSDSSSYIAAVSIDLFDHYPGYNGANPNNNPVCNRQVKATYQGKSVTVRIVDRCTGCASKDLDFSPLAFQQLADPSVGRLTGVTWEWV